MALKEAGTPSKRLVQVRLLDPEPLLYHAEPVLRDGVVVGYVRAASYGWTLGSAVGLAFVTASEPVTADWLADRLVAGRRRRHAVRRRGLAAADVRPALRAGAGLTAQRIRSAEASDSNWATTAPVDEITFVTECAV